MRRILPTNSKVTPIEAGRRAERSVALRRSKRIHPASGAGVIKGDFSDEDTVTEFKLVNPGTKSHALSVSQVVETLKAAELVHKEAAYVIHIPEHNITIEAVIRRGRP